MFPTQIPAELIFKILDLLPLYDQVIFSSTCKNANNFMNDYHFWLPRIKALDPSCTLEPTRQHFCQIFKRTLDETAFFTKNTEKINTLLENHPEQKSKVTQQLAQLQTLCLNPWGEDHLKHLASIHELIESINATLIEAQLPTSTFSLRLQCITRLPAGTIAAHADYFANVGKLELQENLLQRLPDNIDTCQNCTSLNLYDNPMRKLPDSFARLQGIQFLYFSNGCMPHIPASLYKLKNLQWLSFSHMHLTELSADIKQLKNLTWLYLCDNQIAVLPEDFYKLTKLRELFIDHNPLSPLQFHRVLELLRKIQCDVHDAFKTQFMLLKKANEGKKTGNDVNDLVERFNLLSMAPPMTPLRNNQMHKRSLTASSSAINLGKDKGRLRQFS
ncbi:leucine-rich repeat domain-containing protein [Candidatus Berkiella aquae]|uniref:Leucine Rich repeats (2 copies) n=1 Tax=Candidatus Berkiella aquae TaxID=295108 RepID=A0A0Q9YWX4_9GAMM|nr:leucine-rich repeat domain-containing protein [Candidatus Berkiella aquae]MCS5711392.1 leucine-rich repeat domain-containing protein [Candidatus Berkiella aquae]